MGTPGSGTCGASMGARGWDHGTCFDLLPVAWPGEPPCPARAVVLEPDGGAGFRVRVLDDGPGFPPDALPQLGERTFRTDEARRRDPQGSGLGLAIVAELCRRCGWTLEFTACAPRGLEVTLSGPSVP